MRIYKHAAPYHGRAPEPAPKAGGGQALRQPSKAEPKIKYWSEPRGAETSKGGIGDVADGHLNGKGSPYSAAYVGKKK